MEDLERFYYLITKGNYKDAYAISLDLLNKGLPITTLRSKIYDYFIQQEKRQKIKIVRYFKKLDLEDWL